MESSELGNKDRQDVLVFQATGQKRPGRRVKTRCPMWSDVWQIDQRDRIVGQVKLTAAVGDQVDFFHILSQASNHASVLLMRMFLKYCQTTNKTSKSIIVMDDFVFC